MTLIQFIIFIPAIQKFTYLQKPLLLKVVVNNRIYNYVTKGNPKKLFAEFIQITLKKERLMYPVAFSNFRSVLTSTHHLFCTKVIRLLLADTFFLRHWRPISLKNVRCIKFLILRIIYTCYSLLTNNF